MRAVRVLILGKWPEGSPQNGVEAHFSNLACHLSDEIDVHVLSFGKISDQFSVNGVHVRTIERKRVYRALPLLALQILLRDIKAINPDIVHVQGSNPSPYLYATLLHSRCPMVITMHGLSVHERIAEGSMAEGGVKHRWASFSDVAMLRKADLVIVVDSKKKDMLIQQGHDASRIECIPNGVDVNILQTGLNDESIERVWERYQLGTGRKVLCAKAMMPNNGQGYLVQAMRLLVERDPALELLLAGNGPERDGLIKMVRELGIERNVRFLGDVPHEDIPALLHLSSMAVLPSLRGKGAEEGSSIFLLEAMALGRPVVATNIGGNPETIIDGMTGLLVPERDHEALSHAMWSLLDDGYRAREIGLAARSFIAENRNWKIIADRYVEQYRILMEKKTRI